VFVLADSVTRYSWDMALYSDKSHNELGVFIRNTVLRLIDCIDSGHVLYVDSYYTNMELARILIQAGIGFIGRVM